MAELMKWPQTEAPSDFYRKISHLWLQHEDGRIEVVKKTRYDENGKYIKSDENAAQYDSHADCWGEFAWETERRGYYSEEYGLVTAHCGVERNADLMHKLARKFRDAIYYNR